MPTGGIFTPKDLLGRLRDRYGLAGRGDQVMGPAISKDVRILLNPEIPAPYLETVSYGRYRKINPSAWKPIEDNFPAIIEGLIDRAQKQRFS